MTAKVFEKIYLEVPRVWKFHVVLKNKICLLKGSVMNKWNKSPCMVFNNLLNRWRFKAARLQIKEHPNIFKKH